MARVDRFRRAEEDLLAIAEYIGRDNPSAAALWLDRIEEKLLLLASNPYMGEAVDHLRPGVRRFSHGNYVIFYEPRQTGIGLVRACCTVHAVLKTCCDAPLAVTLRA
ncbi:MAG TPA: type II toxin-antitoxin system RelE/ParE family toxin [Lacipirellulaceae bacterium]